jgi:hypothetical protein
MMARLKRWGGAEIRKERDCVMAAGQEALPGEDKKILDTHYHYFINDGCS